MIAINERRRAARHSRLILVALVTTLACACAREHAERQDVYVRPGAPAVQTTSIGYDEDDRRERAEVRPDETLVVRLESRGGTDSRWELAGDARDNEVVSIVSEPQVPPPLPGRSVPPQPKWDVFTFCALRPGTTTLRFNHVRLTDPDAPPTKRAEVRVEVKP